MQSRHIVRDGIETVEKYVETLSLKAQANIPGATSMISTAQKVGSPVISRVRRLGDPVVDAIDNGIHTISKNGIAVFDKTSGFAQNGVQGAMHVVDRVLTPPPNEPASPQTLRGLFVHINNAIRYLCKTKVKPIIKFDPYDKVADVVSLLVYVSTLMYALAMAPWYAIRNRIEPVILWGLDHHCDRSHASHGSNWGNAPNGIDTAYEPEHKTSDDDARDQSGMERSTTQDTNSSSSSGHRGGSSGNNTGIGAGGTRCSTGSGVHNEASKSGTMSHHHSGGHGHSTSKRASSRSGTTTAKANAGNSHDDT